MQAARRLANGSDGVHVDLSIYCDDAGIMECLTGEKNPDCVSVVKTCNGREAAAMADFRLDGESGTMSFRQVRGQDGPGGNSAGMGRA
jgi:hypothetical protein